jgi:hypothetical protein
MVFMNPYDAKHFCLCDDVLWRVAVRGLHAAYYHPWLPACDWNEHARGWPQGTWFADEVRLIERI